MTHHFTIPGEPVAKARPRAVRVGDGVRAYTPAKTTHFENLVKLSAQAAGMPKLDGGVVVHIKFVLPRPKRLARKKDPDARMACISGKDVDNLAKSVLDGLNGIAYDDDRQVYSLHVLKLYAAKGEASLTEVAISGETGMWRHNVEKGQTK